MASLRILTIGASCCVLLGCQGSGGSPTATPPLPWPATSFPELAAPEEAPEVLAARVELGRLLFYDPILSADRETACATCHSEVWGMSDGLPRSIGHGAGLLAGPGREGGAVMRRNAPQLWNMTFRETFFWDGRVQSLEQQALQPLRADEELDRPPQEVVRDLRSLDGYVRRFEAAFPMEPRPTVENMASALAAFQRQLVSKRSLYDSYVQGDRLALSEAQIDGMFRFEAMGCAGCHVPPLFEGEAFYDRGVVESEDVQDEGRYEVTGKATDRDAFRVPTLRNAAFSEPYFHNGSVPSLSAAVRHELGQSGKPFDSTDVEKITRFIASALTDESQEPDRPDTLPSGLRVPVDGRDVVR